MRTRVPNYRARTRLAWVALALSIYVIFIAALHARNPLEAMGCAALAILSALGLQGAFWAAVLIRRKDPTSAIIRHDDETETVCIIMRDPTRGRLVGERVYIVEPPEGQRLCPGDTLLVNGMPPKASVVFPFSFEEEAE